VDKVSKSCKVISQPKQAILRKKTGSLVEQNQKKSQRKKKKEKKREVKMYVGFIQQSPYSSRATLQ